MEFQLDTFDGICRAMADPSFYPHPVFRLERRDTHISSVFLTGKLVYKLKKPVEFGFLDFRNLDARKYYCEREINLNQRLSQGIYLEVIGIYESGNGGYTLEKNGKIVEYAVRMKQLPDAVCLKELLKNNKAHRSQLIKLGHTLADFYGKCDNSPEISHYGQNEVISFNMEENFQQMKPFSGTLIDPEKWEFICEVSRSFLKNRSSFFKSRVEAGSICDGHGDLRSEHIYFYQGVQIIDCIEFNDRFRYGDAAVDLAFLHTDLEHLGFEESSQIVLRAYMERAHDTQLYALLDFYAAYRAIVRLKVTCLRLLDVKNHEQQIFKKEINRYMNQVYRYAVQFGRPTLWIFCGLPGSGKSTIAAQVADAHAMPLFSSDRIRKENMTLYDASRSAEQASRISHHASGQKFGEGHYTPEKRSLVYARLLSLAQESLREGHSAALDATFSFHKWRNEALQLAVDMAADIIFVECICSETSIRQRLAQRETRPGLSDARLEHLPELMEHFEPLIEIPQEIHLKINTDQAVNDAVGEILSRGYACKSAQVIKIL